MDNNVELEEVKVDKASQRRHHKARLRKKRMYDMTHHSSQPINKHVTTPTACSCNMCGNPRNHCGNSKISRTIQEQRLLQKDKY